MESGFLFELFSYTQTEVNDLLESDNNLKLLVQKWNRWKEQIQDKSLIIPLPFTEIEINYLNSPIIDDLVAIIREGCLSPNDAFSDTCYNGYFEVAKWLITIFPNISLNDWEFSGICSKGYLEIAKWLITIFPNINVRELDDTAFRIACDRGHLKVAQWLKSSFPDINHRAVDDYAFRTACENGHLEVAQWLKTTFPDINHRAGDDYAFKLACKRGHREVVQWLIELSQFTTVDILLIFLKKEGVRDYSFYNLN